MGIPGHGEGTPAELQLKCRDSTSNLLVLQELFSGDPQGQGVARSPDEGFGEKAAEGPPDRPGTETF